jgi:pyruvate ferredoxin oxidoreductase gamma subunit
MFQVRVHGRGGQGVVTTAELLSVAAFAEGRHAQAFPSFGSERTGAPVVAFCRIDDRPIRVREPIDRPDAVIVQDATLLGQVDVFGGLAEDGYVLVNTARPLAALGLPGHAIAVPATDLAIAGIGRPLPGAALLGGFAALTGRIGLESVLTAIRERFPGQLGERNAAIAQQAFGLVSGNRRELTRAQAD